MKFIESQVASTVTASLTIGSGGTIPQTYSHLLLYCSAASTSGTNFDSIRCRFNGNSTANSYYGLILYGNSLGWTLTTQNASSAFIGDGAGNSSGAGKFGASWILIPNYASTSLKKQWFGYTTSAADAGNVYTEPVSGYWDFTTAITSLQLLMATGDIKQYSRFDLYGLE